MNAIEQENYYVTQAHEHLLAGDLERAADAVNMAIKINPRSAKGLFYMGLFSQIRECPEDALMCFNQSVEWDDTYIPSHIGRAQALLQLQRNDDALKVLEQTTQFDLSKVEPDWAISLAKNISAHINIHKACEYLEKYHLHHPENKEILEALIEQALHQGKIFNALKWSAQLKLRHPQITEFSNDKHIHFSLLSKEWNIKLLHQSILETLDYATQRDPFWAVNDGSEQVAAIKAGDYDQAVKSGENLVSLNKNSEISDYVTGSILLGLSQLIGRPDLRERAVQFACRCAKEGWSQGCLLLSKSLLPDDKLHNDGIRWAEAVLTLDPANKEAHQILGYEKFNTGKVLDGLRHFHNSMTIDEKVAQDHPLSKYNLRFIDDGSTYSMGALAINIEALLKMQILGWIPKFNFSLLAIPGRVSNPCLLEYWKDHINVISDRKIIDELYPTAKKLSYDASFFRMPDGRVMFSVMAMTLIQQEWDRRGLPPLLSIKDEHKNKAWNVLESVGIPRGSWFVALHVREGGFKQEGAHKFNAHRNASIDTYIPAIKEITDRGGWVIRMGESSMNPLPKMKNVFDYAHSNFKSDWMDIFLCGEARFYLGASGGIFLTPNIFGTPILGTNWPPTICGYCSNSIVIPKMMKRKETDEYISFKEMMSPPIIHAESGIFIEELGFELVDNSEDEILDATIEMLDQLDGKILYSNDDHTRMDKYYSFLDPAFGVFNSRCGKEFLKKYHHLL
jgi:putative glycosyltransferase (TIGR04372 family)